MYAHGFRYYFTPRLGFFSPFPHGTGPLSVTKEYLGLTGGPARFARNFTGFGLLGVTSGSRCLACTGVSPSMPGLSSPFRLQQRFVDSLSTRQDRLDGPTTPYAQRLPAITHVRFSLFRFRSPLLTESRLFSLPVGTEMFHFPTFPPNALCVQAPVAGHYSGWVSPFGHPRISARLPTPRGLSQAPTSFIGSWCLGIHHAH